MGTSFPLGILLLLSPATSLPAVTCSPLPVLEISDVRSTLVGDQLKKDRVLDALVMKDGQPFPAALVRLYIGHALVEQTLTDMRGHFLLEYLTVGRYTLSIQGFGRITLEVTDGVQQQSFYSFSSNHGCLSWGASTD